MSQGRPHARIELLVPGCQGWPALAASQWIAAKAAAVNTPGNAPALHHSETQADRTHWNAARQGLREAEDIWLQVIVVAGKEASCTPKARLYLINNQQGPAFATE